MADTTYEIFPSTGFTVTHFLVSADVKKSLDFYSRILGGKVVMDGENGAPSVTKSDENHSMRSQFISTDSDSRLRYDADLIRFKP